MIRIKETKNWRIDSAIDSPFAYEKPIEQVFIIFVPQLIVNKMKNMDNVLKL